MFIKLDEIQSNNKKIVALAKKGGDLIAELKTFIQQAVPVEFKLEKETPHMLQYLYFGYRLIFRIEILYNHENSKGSIMAYCLPYGPEPEEVFTGMDVGFDSLGNVTMLDDAKRTHKFSPNEFSQPFVSKVFGGILGDGNFIVLRP